MTNFRNLMTKGAIAAGLLAAMTFAVTPSEARSWRHGGGHWHHGWHHGGWGAGAAVAGGFAAGALIGAAAANSYYGPGYAYYGGPYAYAPSPDYASPGGCWHVTDDWRGYGYYGDCDTPRLSSAARAEKKKY